MLTFGVGLGALLFVIGLVTYVLAPRVGPNPIFGVRVGYSYATREVWDKTNRFGGALFALIGVGVAGLSVFLGLVNTQAATGMGWVTAVTILSVLAATGWMFVYARRLARGSEIAHAVAPVRFQWRYIAPVLTTFGILAAIMLFSFSQLPATHLATHFDINNQADGWSSRDAFVVGFAGLAALIVLIDLVVVVIATREPLVALSRWGSRWFLEPASGLVYLGMAFSLVNVILIAVYLDIVSFNTRGVHLFPLAWILWFVVLIIAVLIGLFLRLAKRVSSPA